MIDKDNIMRHPGDVRQKALSKQWLLGEVKTEDHTRVSPTKGINAGVWRTMWHGV